MIAACYGSRMAEPRRLHLSYEQLEVLERCNPKVPVLLMVSPFLPPGLVGCTWGRRQLRVVSQVYETRSSRVYHAEHLETGYPVALKCYKKPNMSVPQKVQALREIWYHTRISHANIIAQYAAWLESDEICLAIEYAPKGSVFRTLQRYGRTVAPAHAARQIMHPVLNALLFLHQMGLIHRDVKPENLLWTDGGCKLADLGLVINEREEIPNTTLGTYDYMAPELFRLPRKHHPMAFKRVSQTPACDAKVDVWACGVLLYELTYGKAPFAADTESGTCDNILQGFDGTFPETDAHSGLCDLGKHFVTLALTHRPSHRPSISALLSHPWICKFVESPAQLAASLRANSMRIMASFGASLDDTEETWTDLLTNEELSCELGE